MIDSTVSPTLSRHVAIYERVSTEAQSVEMQDSDLRRYCEQRQLGIYDIYIDHKALQAIRWYMRACVHMRENKKDAVIDPTQYRCKTPCENGGNEHGVVQDVSHMATDTHAVQIV